MKYLLKLDRNVFTLLLAVIIIGGTQTNLFGQVRTSPTYEKPDKRKVLFPKTKFNAQAAKKALERGNGKIIGKACVYMNKRFYRPRGVRVSLYPATPYIREFFELRKKHSSKKTIVKFSDRAYKTRIDTRTNNRGEFQFTDMKPGNYIVYMAFDFNEIRYRREKAGSAVGVYGRTNVYRNKKYTIPRRRVFEENVQLKKDGETKKITLKRGYSGVFKTGC